MNFSGRGRNSMGLANILEADVPTYLKTSNRSNATTTSSLRSLSSVGSSVRSVDYHDESSSVVSSSKKDSYFIPGITGAPRCLNQQQEDDDGTKSKLSSSPTDDRRDGLSAMQGSSTRSLSMDKKTYESLSRDVQSARSMIRGSSHRSTANTGAGSA